MAVALWDGPSQEVEMTLAGSGEDRIFSNAEIQFARQGKNPSWIDFEGCGFVRPIAESYAVIV